MLLSYIRDSYRSRNSRFEIQVELLQNVEIWYKVLTSQFWKALYELSKVFLEIDEEIEEEDE